MGADRVVYGMLVPWTPLQVGLKSENAADLFLILSSPF